jgi:hypothetical protein
MYWPEFWSAGWNGPVIELQRRFRRYVLSCGQCRLLGLLNFEEKDAVDLQNIKTHSSNDTALHPSQFKFSCANHCIITF